MPADSLYFIALIPHETVANEVTGFKKDFAQNYNSSKALRTMPHITLKAPFKLTPKEHNGLLKWFENIRPRIDPFIVELEDFGSFENKDNPVIYVKPIMSPGLERLQKTILTSFQNTYPHINIALTERRYHPHMTIAFRDLSPEQYERAIDVYQHKKYSATFRAETFYLLQHDGEKWNVIAGQGLK